MSVFEKRFFWKMLLYSYLTSGLYLAYYAFRTAWQLKKIGGKIPNLILIGVSLLLIVILNGILRPIDDDISSILILMGLGINLYFGYYYVNAYCSLIKNDTSIWTRCWYLIFYKLSLLVLVIMFNVLCGVSGYLGYQEQLSKHIENYIFIYVICIFPVIQFYWILIDYMLFQRGFNKYVEKQQILIGKENNYAK